MRPGVLKMLVELGVFEKVGKERCSSSRARRPRRPSLPSVTRGVELGGARFTTGSGAR